MTSDQKEEVHQGNFKKALQTIAFIMNGSIDVGTTLNLESEVSTAVDLDSHSATTTNGDLDSEISEALKSNSSSSLDSEGSMGLNSTTGDVYVNVRDEVTWL